MTVLDTSVLLHPDNLAYLAAALMVASTLTNNVCLIRPFLVSANICLISYGVFLGLMPIVVLNGIMAPINAVQTWRAWREKSHADSARPNPNKRPILRTDPSRN